jgi:hypothetical protein
MHEGSHRPASWQANPSWTPQVRASASIATVQIGFSGEAGRRHSAATEVWPKACTSTAALARNGERRGPGTLCSATGINWAGGRPTGVKASSARARRERPLAASGASGSLEERHIFPADLAECQRPPPGENDKRKQADRPGRCASRARDGQRRPALWRRALASADRSHRSMLRCPSGRTEPRASPVSPIELCCSARMAAITIARACVVAVKY